MAARRLSLSFAKRIASERGQALGNDPPSPQVLGAIARAERMSETLRSIVITLSRGTPPQDRTAKEHHDRLARDVEELWAAIARGARSEASEAAMHFVSAAEYASKLETTTSQRVSRARRAFAARFPELAEDVDRAGFERAISACRGQEKKWPTLLEITSAHFGEAFDGDLSLKRSYMRWKKQ